MNRDIQATERTCTTAYRNGDRHIAGSHVARSTSVLLLLTVQIDDAVVFQFEGTAANVTNRSSARFIGYRKVCSICGPYKRYVRRTATVLHIPLINNLLRRCCQERYIDTVCRSDIARLMRYYIVFTGYCCSIFGTRCTRYLTTVAIPFNRSSICIAAHAQRLAGAVSRRHFDGSRSILADIFSYFQNIRHDCFLVTSACCQRSSDGRCLEFIAAEINVIGNMNQTGCTIYCSYRCIAACVADQTKRLQCRCVAHSGNSKVRSVFSLHYCCAACLIIAPRQACRLVAAVAHGRQDSTISLHFAGRELYANNIVGVQRTVKRDIHIVRSFRARILCRTASVVADSIIIG